MATRKASKVQPSNIARFHLAKDAIVEREFQGIDWESAVGLAAASSKFEDSIVLGLFTGVAAPTFNDFKAYRKSVDPLGPVPTKANNNTLYLVMYKASKIQEAVEAGFNPLEAWEKSVIKRIRQREPNISALLTLARAFMNGEKVVDAGAEFEQALIAAYRKALNLPNTPTAQYNVNTLAAIATKNKITLPKE